MEQTLKVTNILSDPTRYSIYETFINENKQMTVNEVAELFDIHPNVARLHLSKLNEINLINAYYKKTGKGGRPSRIYELSDHVIELSFPRRDYKMLAQIMLESFVDLGDIRKEALYKTGKKYGAQIMYENKINTASLSPKEKIKILEETGTMLGMYPKFEYDEENPSINLTITNCPFKELAKTNTTIICNMHNNFLKGMLASIFPDVQLTEKENMLKGCNNCKYVAELN